MTVGAVYLAVAHVLVAGFIAFYRSFDVLPGMLTAGAVTSTLLLLLAVVPAVRKWALTLPLAPLHLVQSCRVITGMSFLAFRDPSLSCGDLALDERWALVHCVWDVAIA
jgi:hypothetical protein